MSNGILLRVGVDAQAGQWNAPCRTDGTFCYVPIPASKSNRGPRYDRLYSEFEPFATRLGADWPSQLSGPCHLDPDFSHLTYGDLGARGRRIRETLSAGDFIAFWAGLRSMDTGDIVCSIIGYFCVSCVMNASEIGPLDHHRNAHVRQQRPPGQRDIVVFGNPSQSGRLLRHIPIGHFRDGAQRVDRDLLKAWGGLKKRNGGDWPDGYIQMSAAPPIFRMPERFLKWFSSKKPRLIHANNA